LTNARRRVDVENAGFLAGYVDIGAICRLKSQIAAIFVSPRKPSMIA